MINNFKQYGISVGLLRSAKRLISPFLHWESYIFARNEINTETIHPQADLNIDVLILKQEDITLLPVNKDKKCLFLHRLKDPQNVCLIARYKNQIIYYAWLSTKLIELESIGMSVPLKYNEGYLFDAYCFPEFRGQNLHSYMSRKRLEILNQKGKKYAYVSYLKDNRVAEKVMKKIGFIPICEYRCFTLLSRYNYIIKNYFFD